MGNKYTIKFSGLALGNHQFRFTVANEFFDSIEFGEIRKGDLSVKVDMVKEETMLVLDFDIVGTVNIMCDRCSELYDQEIKGRNQLIVKFGDEAQHNTDDILVLPRGESEMSVTLYIYEFIHLLLPQKRVHPEGDCDQEVVDRLNELSASRGFKDGDPRWDALKEVL